MLKVVVPYLAELGFKLLPRWLAKLVTSPQKIADKVVIDLRSQNAIDITFGSAVPDIDVWFRISNMSLTDLVLDRLLVDLWVSQPTLQAAILHRLKIPKREEKEIHFRHQLSLPQQEWIREQTKDNTVSVTIDAEAYFDSKIGLVHVKKHLERWHIPSK